LASANDARRPNPSALTSVPIETRRAPRDSHAPLAGCRYCALPNT
jgi:hypothetical protein